tara:strand:- start:17 stop:286 length:270 start_codon:yes stop_codon:yes gene_type:complete
MIFPTLQHLCSLIQELCAIVCAAQRIFNRMRKLMLKQINTKAKFLIKPCNSSRAFGEHRARAALARCTEYGPLQRGVAKNLLVNNTARY